MSDTTLNRFLASGTNAQRLAFTPSPATPASGPSPTYFWGETDTGNSYFWNFGSAAWVQVNTGGGGTTTNALTANNSGTGDASGMTFNGSAAKTISYNTIGAAPAGLLTAAGLTMNTGKLLGRTTAAVGAVEELSTVPAANFPALTGDVTTSAGSLSTAIAANSVTYAKMQDISATSRFLGRITAGAGDTEELTGTQATTLLDAFTSTLKGLAPASGGGTTNFLRADGTWAAPAGGGTVTTTGTPANGNLTKFSGATSITNGDLSGDVTTSGTLATTIANNAVTDAKLRQSAGLSVIGRSTNTTGNVADITGAANGVLRVSGTTLAFGAVDVSTAMITGDLPFANLAQGTARSVLAVAGNATADFASVQGTTDQVLRIDSAGTSLGFGTIATGGIAANAVTLAKLATQANNTILGNNSGSTAVPSALTGTQVTALLDTFTSSLKGLAPSSGGGTTNFLRADGTWAVPAGGGGTTTNPLTMNNSGSGAASGSTFDGSVARTISYNTIGAPGLAAANSFTADQSIAGGVASAWLQLVKAMPSSNFANTGPTSTVLTASATGVVTFDGQTINLNDLVLFQIQTNSQENGVYKCTTAGAVGVAAVFTRVAELNTWALVAQNHLVRVQLGTIYADTIWHCKADPGGTLGTTAITYSCIAHPTTLNINPNGLSSLNGVNGLTLQAGGTTSITISTNGNALTVASSTSRAGIRIPHGSAPTTPNDGDFWSTTSGFFGQVNGSTVGPFGAGGGSGTVTTTGTPANGNLTKFSGATSITNGDLSGDVTTSGALATTIASNHKTRSITFVIDGAGATITTGLKGYLEVPFGCTIAQATLLADQSGSIVVDVWKCTYSQFDAGSTHPVSGDKITSSTPPTISSATKSQDSTLTSWTTSISAGDILAFNVNSVTTIQRVTLSLKVTTT